jgi:tagatose 6-phosphate kinase
LSPARLATVTLNATLDRVLLVPGLQTGTIHETLTAVTLAGGKGLNAARTARALGATVTVTGLVAGRSGRWVRSLLEEEGIPAHLLELPEGESRISTIVVDAEARQTTVINDLGPRVAPELWPEVCLKLVAAVAGYPWVVLAGASLPGLPHSVYADLCRTLQRRGQRVCLDARDQWLAHALPSHPFLVKCNQYEAARVLGGAIDTPEQARDAASEWAQSGIHRVVLTLSKRGAVAVEDGQAWHLAAPEVDALYPVGSGDAMMGAMVVALARGGSWLQAVQYGVAVGAANTLQPGSGRCELSAVPGLMERTTVRPI